LSLLRAEDCFLYHMSISASRTLYFLVHTDHSLQCVDLFPSCADRYNSRGLGGPKNYPGNLRFMHGPFLSTNDTNGPLPAVRGHYSADLSRLTCGPNSDACGLILVTRTLNGLMIQYRTGLVIHAGMQVLSHHVTMDSLSLLTHPSTMTQR